MANLKELEEAIGYSFTDRTYLERAITHSSYANETGEKNHHLYCYERLEFLGDAVLSLLTSEFLYRRFPNAPEGELTRMRASLVCEETLASYAETLSLGSYLYLGKGEAANGGAQKPAILADVFEALLAAIYLDAKGGGMQAVSDFLLPILGTAIAKLPVGGGDSKTFLQIFLQKEGSVRPEYRVVSETGPDHAKVFCVEAYLDSNCIGRGRGTTKRHAEQEAAADALRLFGVDR